MKTVRVCGASLLGTEAELVTVEARFYPADCERTDIVLTGLPDPVLRESKGRLECALKENGLALASGRLYLNLVPAARRKSGEILDLPLALGAGAAAGHFDPRVLQGTLFLGELGIDGRLHAVPGGLAAAMAARKAGFKRLFAPPATAGEAANVRELEVFGSKNLAQVLAHLTGNGTPLVRLEPGNAVAPQSGARTSLDEVRGLWVAKYALAVAAAGGHGLLLVGPPGAGKSLLAQRLVRLLPPPTFEERLEITLVLSAAGRWPGGLAVERPYRAPHHTISYAGLVGGGPNATPGEVTLAHRGVLFLDELPEFRREVLESLRQPLEQGSIAISRATRRVELPSRFQLVAAMNPCPCGYLGHPRIPCRCPPRFVERYRHRISGPLLDRIDLCVEITPPTIDELAPLSPGAGSPEGAGPAAPESIGLGQSDLALRVASAIERTRARQGARANAELTAADLDSMSPLCAGARKLLSVEAQRRGLSARALQALRRVARTIADLEGEASVSAAHHAQAIALRAAIP